MNNNYESKTNKTSNTLLKFLKNLQNSTWLIIFVSVVITGLNLHAYWTSNARLKRMELVDNLEAQIDLYKV
jgi:hypothetical protein